MKRALSLLLILCLTAVQPYSYSLAGGAATSCGDELPIQSEGRAFLSAPGSYKAAANATAGFAGFGSQLSANSFAVYTALSTLAPDSGSINISIPKKLTFTSASSQPTESELAQFYTQIGKIVQAAVDALLKDDPYMFWLYLGPGGSSYGYANGTGEYVGTGVKWTVDTLVFNPVCNPEYTNAAALINEIKNEVRSFTPSGKNRYAICKQIHDYISATCRYGTSGRMPHEAYGALCEGVAVCEGYAKAFKLLCDANNVPCTLVVGTGVSGSGSEPHMWNYVQLENGRWYAVDVTWDDQGASTYYDFFMAGANTVDTHFGGRPFSASHINSGRFSYEGQIFQYPELNAAKMPSGPRTLGGTVKVSGNAWYDQTLTADISGLSIQDAVLSYTWRRASEPDSKGIVQYTTVGTGSTYKVTREDLGRKLTVTVTGKIYADGSVTSQAVTPTKMPAAAVPSAPKLASKTSTDVRLTAVSGCEYGIMSDGKINWQSSDIFSKLVPGTAYDFYLRYAETDVMMASQPSPALRVVTNSVNLTGTVKISGIAENGSTLTVDTSGLVPAEALGTVVWYRTSSAGEDKVIGRNSSYIPSAEDIGQSIYAVFTGTAGYVGSFKTASVTVTKKTVQAPAAPAIAERTTTSVTLVAAKGCEYKCGSGPWQKSPLFTGLEPNTLYTFYARLSETALSSASAESAPLSIWTMAGDISGSASISGEPAYGSVLTVILSQPDATAAYTVQWYAAAAGGDVLLAVSEQLTPGSDLIGVTIYAVVTADKYYGLLRTEKVTVTKATVAAPAAPAVRSKTSYSITLIEKAGFEYSMDAQTWQKSGTFTGLDEDTPYTFYARVAETDTSFASPASMPLTVRTSSKAPERINTEVYTVNAKDGLLTGVETGITAKDLRESIDDYDYISVHAADGSRLGDDSPVGTGCLVVLTVDGAVLQTLSVVITGDFNGDGRITVTDFVRMKMHLLGTSVFSGCFLSAADINGDGSVTVTDYVRIKQHLLGINEIVPAGHKNSVS